MAEAAQKATEYARDQSDARIAERVATIEDSGTQVVTLSEEFHDQIREVSQPVYESIRSSIDEAIYDAYLN